MKRFVIVNWQRFALLQALSSFDLDQGDSLFLMNGMQIDFTDTDMFE